MIRGRSDAELDRASPVSLHWNAPLTTQYFIEEHPLSHSYEHAAAIRSAIGTIEFLLIPTALPGPGPDASGLHP